MGDILSTVASPAMSPSKTAGIEENRAEKGEEESRLSLFMKGGGCRETFLGWEKCIEEAEKKEEDMVVNCFHEIAALKKCMDAHSDYYAPILQAEKAAWRRRVNQLEEKK